MRVLLDTNILLDFLLQRQPFFSDADAVRTYAQRPENEPQRHEGHEGIRVAESFCVSPGCNTNYQIRAGSRLHNSNNLN